MTKKTKAKTKKNNKQGEEHSHSEDFDLDELAGLMGSMEDPEAPLKRRGIYHLTGFISSHSTNPLQYDFLIKHFDDSFDDDIQLLINSEGGEMSACWSLLSVMKFMKSDIKTVGLGEVCSAAAILLAGGTPGKRSMDSNASLMIHNFSWGRVGSYPDLLSTRKAEDLEYSKHIRFWIANSKYKSAKDVEKHLLKEHDNWMSAEEAKSHGVIDHII